ncbi:MAG: PDZ domain-containing protein, partial [Ignavibacteriae bacterium]|nr:PDZ domain-containing protein [Ignavibacteriota bacterium]
MINIPLFLSLISFTTMMCGTSCAHHTSGTDDIVLIQSGSSHSPWIGVSIQDMSARLARSMGLDVNVGALVNDVVEDSPADSAGVHKEDVIVEFDGTKIDDADDLVRAVNKTDPGMSITMVVMRKTERKSLQVTVGRDQSRKRHRSFAVRPPVVPRFHIFSHTSVYGMKLETLNEQLADYFEVPGRRGVLVEEVERRSASEKAGFRAGDVLLKIGEQAVEQLRDVYEALRDYKDGEKIPFEIMRKGKQQELTLEADESEMDGEYFWEPFGKYHEEHYPPEQELEFFFEDRDGLKNDLNDLRL